MPADRFTSRGSSGCIALLTAIAAARTRTHVHVFVRASLKSPPILPPLPSLCSEEESIPPLRNDHKSALVSLAVNQSAFYWKLFIILHSFRALGVMLGEGAARNVNRVTMTEFSRSPPLSAAFDGESLSPPSARLLSDLLSQRLLLSIRELLSKRRQKFQIVLVSALCLYVCISFFLSNPAT